MERRDMGLPNSIGNYNHPPQESPVKLPLAPIFSTPPERRANSMLSTTRRGSSIFSPSQTLDHHRHNPPSPPQPTSDPDPAPSATLITGGVSNSKNPSPPPPQLQAPPPQPRFNNTSTTSIKYRECLKNHAASMGGHIVDGCGEFMPSGDEDTPEALRCAACDCHRNFHRKEINGEPQNSNHHHNLNSGNNISHRKTPIVLHKQHRGFGSGPTPPTMVNFGGGGAGESSSDDLNMFQSGRGGHASKKRFRTKFSQDQKDKMHEFASKIEWRIQKQNDEEVQQFCSEVGVKRQVFKVWMHNNKQKRQTSD